VLALLIACAGWGGWFTWAKVIMAELNRRCGLADSATVGVLLLLSWRFLLAGIIWMLIFPTARSGWTRASIWRVLILSLPFTIAMIAQQMSLARIAPAVNAFLTSLNVLFVPLIVACITRRFPSRSLAICIAFAVVGIWMLTSTGSVEPSNPGGARIGLGEILGVGCSILFSVHILLINALLKRDTPARMVGGQFLVTGVSMLVLSLLVHPVTRSSAVLFAPFSPGLLTNFLMLVILATLLSFGLMLQFQPRLEPERAALIYLTEPIFAAAYAWILAGDGLTPGQLAGAALIIVANSLVEWLGQRRILKVAIPAADGV